MGNQIPEMQRYGAFREDQTDVKPGYSRELMQDIDFQTCQSCIENLQNPDHFRAGEFEGCKTVFEVQSKSLDKFGSNPFLGTRNNAKEGRPYEWKTFREIYNLMEDFAKGMDSLNLSPVQEAEGKNYRFMGIFSKNREEWAIVNLASMRSSVTIVPFYDSLGPEALSFVLNQTELITMCVDSASLRTLLKVAGNAHTLKNIITFDKADEDQEKQTKELGIRMISFNDVLEEGRKVQNAKFTEPTPDTIYMFCYTSGTTGDPKGAKLSHRYLLGCSQYCLYARAGLCEQDVSISYLPYAHIFEQAIFVTSLGFGFRHGYYSGDPLKLFEDIALLKPTSLVVVPRIMNRIYDKIMAGVANSSGFKQGLFNRAVATKLENLRNNCQFTHWLYDRTVFKPIRDLFGGNLNKMIIGSAPISNEVLSFFKIALGFHIHEIYGQTEAGPLTVTLSFDPTSGHVGGVSATCKLRLRDIPEMEYYHTDNPPRGEVQMKGSHMFDGYFKAPEKTLDTMDDGWITTGDVGIVFPNGSIKLVDRAKNIFKLNQGEYIAPEKLENVYCQCSLISQMFVYGDSLQSFLLGFVVIDQDVVKKWAQDRNIAFDDINVLAKNQELKQAIIEQMELKAKANSLSSLEKIKKIHVQADPFTVQNDIITPTFKIKRNIAKKYFDKEITKMYQEGL
ncbi:long-chain-fatty-acid--ligase 5 [Stylonychia lemnae]|uniref:Long-chain-fatty-acid--ligase 5 n=1 Tax=Stylonychia lemnae TaxID=5949 RepID=A0A078B8C5_STYLE|nr:long-chain-fatty-acid--ligase 5 [Stylonychia lemnae]|eukprot:CDW89813.1 long-chain-fatty-acid--ligase 5 [Stylonychia lemnae]